MDFDLSKLRIVTLDNFYESVELPLARKLFGEIALLRARGYGPEYPEGFLPLDTVDYIAWHYLFCIEDKNGLTAIGGFRQVSLERCDQYHLEVPLYKLMKDEGAAIHAQALSEIITKHRDLNETLVYSSAFTIQKEYREFKNLSQTIKELVPALTLLDIKERQVKTTLGGAVPRFKTDITFKKWGYHVIEHDGKPLPAIQRPSIGNDLAVIMELRDVTPYTIDCYNKHKALINSRLVLEPQKSLAVANKKAA